MSARNGREARHAAEARRRAAARSRKPETTIRPPGPPGLDRDAIAEALHQAVCLVGRDGGMGHCEIYAWAGAAVLTKISGQPWHWQAGSAWFGTGQDVGSPNGEVTFAWVSTATEGAVWPDGAPAHGGGYAGGELHAWCARKGPGVAVEIADFAARHVPAYAEMSGIGWAREPIPYAWGTPAELAGRRFQYRADRPTVNEVVRIVSANPSAYEDAATLTLWKLGAITDRRAAGLIHDLRLLDLMRDGYTIAESFPGGFIAVR